MGPYCTFCDNRCFVERRIPDPRFKHITIMATCREGMRYELETTGYTHETAINPRSEEV